LATLKANGLDTNGWPDLLWTRDSLASAMLSIHPQQRAMRAKVAQVRTQWQSELKSKPPELNAALEHHSQTSDGKNSPWAVGAGLQWELTQPTVRNALQNLAELEIQDAQLNAGESAWRLYRALGTALLERHLSMGRLQLARSGLELALARDKSVLVRDRYGVATALEVQQSAQRVQDARRELVQAQAALTAAMTQLATTLTIPVDSIHPLRIADWPSFELVSASQAQAIALNNQLAFARERLQYELTEAQLRLEVAKQFPNIKLSPGLLWSQGDSVWQLGLSLPAALLNRNLPAIQAAQAKRHAQGMQLLATQSEIIGEVERLRLNALSLTEPLALAQTAFKAAQSQVQLIQAQWEAGNVDTLTVIETQGLQLQAQRAVFEAQAALLQAQWALELALQSPLSWAPLK
jgi:outer membrane protein TolC